MICQVKDPGGENCFLKQLQWPEELNVDACAGEIPFFLPGHFEESCSYHEVNAACFKDRHHGGMVHDGGIDICQPDTECKFGGLIHREFAAKPR